MSLWEGFALTRIGLGASSNWMAACLSADFLSRPTPTMCKMRWPLTFRRTFSEIPRYMWVEGYIQAKIWTYVWTVLPTFRYWLVNAPIETGFECFASKSPTPVAHQPLLTDHRVAVLVVGTLLMMKLFNKQRRIEGLWKHGTGWLA